MKKRSRHKQKRRAKYWHMPARTQSNVQAFMADIKDPTALAFAKEMGPVEAFELLHGMRRWYSGQTMARLIKSKRPALRNAMKIEPRDAIGVYRGFKVDKDSSIAKMKLGQRFSLPVTRNHGFSSWSTTEAPTNRFSGGGKGKVGVIIQLMSEKGVTPVLAPPDRSKSWFNSLYRDTIGTSFRPTEGEYLIHGNNLDVRLIKLKR